MILHSVDFIGGDFDVGAFSTVGDGFSDPEFAAPGNSLLCGLGGLDDTCRECTGFIIMLRHPQTWRVYSHGCYKFDNADMGFGPRDLTAHFPAFLHLRVTNLPGPDRIVRSDMEKVAGRYERKRLRKRLASSTATSSTLPSATPTDATQHVAGRDHAQSSLRLPIGSMPKRPAPVPGQNLCLCLCLCVCLGVCQLGLAGQGRVREGTLPCPVPASLLLIISFDWDPGDPGHLAQINLMPNRELCTHGSTSSTVSSGQLLTS